ncbi:MAG: hypothetical protein LC118_12635 [Dehalococcoidia bacterium]|nr:hypothetical protein [Dehalococcoidia bacterium]
MKIQLITLTGSSMDPRLAGRMRSAIELAVSDTPGIVSTTWIVTAPGVVTGVSAWESQPALDAFRHSELYARLMLCPHLDDARDDEIAAGWPAPASYQPDAEIDLAEWIPEVIYAGWKAARQRAHAA